MPAIQPKRRLVILMTAAAGALTVAMVIWLLGRRQHASDGEIVDACVPKCDRKECGGDWGDDCEGKCKPLCSAGCNGYYVSQGERLHDCGYRNGIKVQCWDYKALSCQDQRCYVITAGCAILERQTDAPSPVLSDFYASWPDTATNCTCPP